MKMFLFVLLAICGLTNVTAQIDEIWETKQGDGGLVITRYKGTERDVFIPANINGVSVIALDTTIVDGNVIRGHGIFVGSEKKKIIIPATVKNIDISSLLMNENVEYILVDPENQWYKSIDGVLFDKSGSTLIAYPAKQAVSYTIPSGVTTFDTRAFEGSYKYLKNINIPLTVTRIHNNYQIGGMEMTVDESNTAYKSIDGVLFDKSGKNLLRYPHGRNKQSYIIPSEVTNIAPFAFGAAQLTSIIIPETVLTIGFSAFIASKIENISISNNVSLANSSIPNDFAIFYNNNLQRAGT